MINELDMLVVYLGLLSTYSVMDTVLSGCLDSQSDCQNCLSDCLGYLKLSYLSTLTVSACLTYLSNFLERLVCLFVWLCRQFFRRQYEWVHVHLLVSKNWKKYAERVLMLVELEVH